MKQQQLMYVQINEVNEALKYHDFVNQKEFFQFDKKF